MKKLFSILMLLSFVFSLIGQENIITQETAVELEKKSSEVVKLVSTNGNDSIKWKIKSVAGLNLSQTSFSNWSGGGENSFATNAYLNAGAYYRNNKVAWDNDLSLEYGIIHTNENGWRKNVDKIDVASKYGYAASKTLFYTALVDFKSQFDKGYNYPNKTQYVSNFMAPAYSTVSIGMDYKPRKDFSAYLSPLTGKFTIVLDDSLSHIGAYGVEIDKNLRPEIGAYAKFTYNADIMKNVNLISKIDLFTAYDENFGNIDVNWEVLLSMKVNKYLTASLSTTLKYDDDIKYIDADGIKHGPRIQFKEIFGLGISYKISHESRKK